MVNTKIDDKNNYVVASGCGREAPFSHLESYVILMRAHWNIYS